MDDHDHENIIIDRDQMRIPPKDDDNGVEGSSSEEQVPPPLQAANDDNGVEGPSSKEQVPPPQQDGDAGLMDVYIPTFIDNNVEDNGLIPSYIAQSVLETIDSYEAHDGNIQIDEVIKFILDNVPHDELRADMERVIEQNANAAREVEDQTRIPPKDDDNGVEWPSPKEQVHPPLQDGDAGLMNAYIPTFIDNNVEDNSLMPSYIAQYVLEAIDLYEAHDGNIQIDEVIKLILDNVFHDELRAYMERVIEQNAAREAEEAKIFKDLADLFQLDSP